MRFGGSEKMNIGIDIWLVRSISIIYPKVLKPIY